MSSQFHHFTKERADPFLFSPLPEKVYSELGGIEHEPLQLMTLSRLVAGCAFGQVREIETHTGKTVTIGLGETWASINTIRDDINAAVGADFSRRQVRYALEKAEKRGLFRSQLILPESRGNFGKRFILGSRLLDPNGPMIDIIQTYRIFRYGDTSKFTEGVKLVGSKDQKWKYGRADSWMRDVAKRGNANPCFTSIGRWRRGEEGQHDAPVFVPWLVIDLDYPELHIGRNLGREDEEIFGLNPPEMERVYSHVYDLLIELRLQGYDLDRTLVSFSGSRGFHVAISSDQFGSPIFYDAVAARETLQRLVASVLDEVNADRDDPLKVDPHPFSPVTLIRLSGSVHERTGWYKRTWIASDFVHIPYYQIFDRLTEHLPLDLPDPRIGAVEASVQAAFERAAHIAADEIKRKREAAQAYGKRVGTEIERILSGIEKSEIWSDRHAGRNKAGFILACWLLESEGQQRAVAYHLNYEPRAPYGTEEAAWELYEYWDKHRNAPPMQDDPDPADRKGFTAAFQSAKRKVLSRVR